MTETVFITGANGFIGSNLCRHFLRAGWTVCGLARPGSDLHFLDGLDVRIVHGDLRDPGSFRLPREATRIVHAASIVSDTASDDLCRRNIFELALNLTTAIRDSGLSLRRLVFISTALTLGYGRANISEDRPGRSAEFLPYTRYKILTESFFLDESRRRGLPVVILRPADVIGPRDRTTSLRLLRNGERGLPLIVGHGRWRFAFTSVPNLGRAVETALTKDGLEGRAYTVTNGRLPTWREFFEAVERGFERRQRVYVPAAAVLAVARGMEAVRKLVPRYDPPLTPYRIKRVTSETTYDISRTTAELDFVPEDDFEDQVAQTLEWYREERSRGRIA